MDLIKTKEKQGLCITLTQLLFITCLFSKLAKSPMKLFFNPFYTVNIIYKPSTIIYAISFLIPVLLNYIFRTTKLNSILLFVGLTISSLMFCINFPITTSLIVQNNKDILFIFKKILININYSITLVASLFSGIILTYTIINQNFGYTDIKGIFKYFALVSKDMCNIILNLWFINLKLTVDFLVIYITIFRFLINLILFFFRCELVYKGRILNHLILLYFSLIVYYSMVEFFNRLLIYNLSLKSKKFTNFSNDKNDFNQRYVFYHVSDLSYRYTYILNKICRSKPDLFNLLDYIQRECDMVKSICKKIIEEYKLLDSRLFMTVPQVNTNGSVIFKKYKNYNFIDKLTYRIFYKIKVWILKRSFNRNFKYMVDVNRYMNYLLKQRDYFMLLSDVDKKYTEIYKDLIDEIRKVEEECCIDLKVTI